MQDTINEITTDQVLFDMIKYAESIKAFDIAKYLISSEVILDTHAGSQAYCTVILNINIDIYKLDGVDWLDFLNEWYYERGRELFTSWDGQPGDLDRLVVPTPEKVEDNWREKLVQEYEKTPTNQGVVTKICFKREGLNTIFYNEMTFADPGEVMCAKALESLNILFLPLPLFVKGKGYPNWEHHREPDFVIFDKRGNPGILEISTHEGRYEKDSEKSLWFKKQGFKVVENWPTSKFSIEEKALESVKEFMGLMETNYS